MGLMRVLFSGLGVVGFWFRGASFQGVGLLLVLEG